MFWNDIRNIKEWMATISCRLSNLEMNYDCVLQEQDDLNSKISKTLDKADDCLKNVDKLNTMINEFKGCVAMARASMNEKKSHRNRKPVKKKTVSRDS